MTDIRRRSQRLKAKAVSTKSERPLQSIKRGKKVTFNPKVQLFLYPLTHEERIRPPVFCRCDDDTSPSSSPSSGQRIPCDGCNQWHTLRCLNIPASTQVDAVQKKSCIRCRKAELWRKVLMKIQIGQPLHYKEVFSVSKKLHIQPSGTTADVLVRLVCFLVSRPQDFWAKPPAQFGRRAQLELIASLRPEVLTATLEQANLQTNGRMRDRLVRLHEFLTSNLKEDPSARKENTAPRRPLTPAKLNKAQENSLPQNTNSSSRPRRTKSGRAKRSATTAWTENKKQARPTREPNTPPPRSSERRVLGDRTNTMITPSPTILKKTRQPHKRSPLPPGEKQLWELATEFRSSLDVFTRDELRTECMNCGLRRGGTKAELAQRLALYLAQQEHRVKASQTERGTHPVSCECDSCLSAVIQSISTL